MLRFAEPTYLWLLWLIPMLVGLRWLYGMRQRKRLKRFGDMQLVRQLTPDASLIRPHVKFALLMAALSMLIVCLARPQMGTRISNEKREGIETIIALDISNSMLAEDVAPSRLEKSKMMVENLVDHFRNDKIGLIVFAGESFVQLPITTDYVSAKMFLHDITPGLIESQGTDIGGALRLATHSFTQDSRSGKAIILITDGEDHEGGAEDMAREAEKNGVRVFILGIGSTSGAPIPMGDGSYLKDEQGQTVMTKLNEQMCKNVAKAGKGTYIHVDNSTLAENTLDKELSAMQKGEINSVVYSDYDEQFQAVAIIALLLLVIETLILERKNHITGRWNIFRRGK